MFLALVAPLSAVEIVAHRGFSERAPENTVAAFKLAWQSGADACELDLYQTADGGIAVLHDRDTRRTTGVSRLVAEATLAELRRLDAGSWKAPEYAGERIPSLAEALATLPEDRGRFLLEIKCGPEVMPELARQLESWKPRAHQLCIIAFDRAAAREAKKALPWLKVYRLSSEQSRDKKPVDLDALIADTVADGLDGLDLSQKWAWNADLVRRVRTAGLELHVWTVNKPEDVRRLAALGVDSITTDNPVMAREALAR
jgi:glycerophosphoryl diester phosphodiesterase